jgi:hypothetical protein
MKSIKIIDTMIREGVIILESSPFSACFCTTVFSIKPEIFLAMMGPDTMARRNKNPIAENESTIKGITIMKWMREGMYGNCWLMLLVDLE